MIVPVRMIGVQRTPQNRPVSKNNNYFKTEFDSIAFTSKKQQAKTDLLAAAEARGYSLVNCKEAARNLLKDAVSVDDSVYVGSDKVYNIPDSDYVLKVNLPGNVNIFDDLNLNQKIDENETEVTGLVLRGAQWAVYKKPHGINLSYYSSVRDASKLISLMPQDTYDDLLAHLSLVHKQGYFVDNTWQDVSLDTKKEKIRPLDVSKKSIGAQYKFSQSGYKKPTKFDPIDCQIKLFGRALDEADYPQFFKKAFVALALDCENFPAFIMPEVDELRSKHFKNTDSTASLTYIYSKLYVLQKLKQLYHEQGYSKKAVAITLHDDIADFLTMADAQIKSKTVSKEKLQAMEKRIAKKNS